MKKSVLRRVTALSAAVMVMTGAAVSCSGKKQDTNNNNGKAKDTQQLMATSYRAVEMDVDVESVNSFFKISQ